MTTATSARGLAETSMITKTESKLSASIPTTVTKGTVWHYISKPTKKPRFANFKGRIVRKRPQQSQPRKLPTLQPPLWDSSMWLPTHCRDSSVPRFYVLSRRGRDDRLLPALPTLFNQ